MCIAITESVYVFHQPRRSVSTRFRSANEILVKIWEDQPNFGPEVDLPIKTHKRIFKFSMYIHEANKLYRVQPKICPPYWISFLFSVVLSRRLSKLVVDTANRQKSCLIFAYKQYKHAEENLNQASTEYSHAQVKNLEGQSRFSVSVSRLP